MNQVAAPTTSPASSITYTESGGHRLAIRDWAAPAGAPRGMVLVVHGLGEHSGRYERLAAPLIEWGFRVRGFDLYGHGLSAGPRGGMDTENRFLDDLAHIHRLTVNELPAGMPLILIGHSFGGLISSHAVAQKVVTPDALVLSSPALDAGLNPFQKLLIATLPRVVPNLRVGTGFQLERLSHDKAIVEACRNDPLAHQRIAARLARFLAEAGPDTVSKAPSWTVPTLLMWAGADSFVAPAGSSAFAAKAPASVVQSQEFPALYHELFNESPELAAPVFATLRAWLERTISASNQPA